MKTVEQLFQEVNNASWLVLNLFQLTPKRWRCNLQKRSQNGATLEYFTEFAEGRTAAEAVQAAIFNTDQPRNNKGAMRTGRGPPPDDKATTIVVSFTSAQDRKLEFAFDRMIAAWRA